MADLFLREWNKMIQVYVKKLVDNAILPTYAHHDDAGMDLYASAGALIWPGERVLVPTGVALAIPEQHVGLIHPRSGLALKNGLTVLNTPGTIDAGYRGEIKILLFNAAKSVQTIKPGDRIAQIVFQRYETAVLNETDDLPEAIRGDNGFGSTGLSLVDLNAS